MNRTEQLDALFNEWRMALGDERSRFVADGIIDESSYGEQEPRLLFLGKEPHDKGEGGWDFRNEWPKDPNWKHARQIKRWAYGILNNFPDWEQVRDEPENTLLKVATMNVKKTGGGSSSVYQDIERHATQHADLARRQVRIIEPHIIIGGLRGYGLWRTLLGEEPSVVMIEGIQVFRWGDAKVIDFYHPSNYYPHSMSYALLSRVVGSKRFRSV